MSSKLFSLSTVPAHHFGKCKASFTLATADGPAKTSVAIDPRAGFTLKALAESVAQDGAVKLSYDAESGGAVSKHKHSYTLPGFYVAPSIHTEPAAPSASEVRAAAAPIQPNGKGK